MILVFYHQNLWTFKNKINRIGHGIYVTNKNKIQDDPRTAVETSGVRIGLPFITNLKKVNRHVLDEIKDCIVSVVLDKPTPVLKYIPKIFK